MIKKFVNVKYNVKRKNYRNSWNKQTLIVIYRVATLPGILEKPGI